MNGNNEKSVVKGIWPIMIVGTFVVAGIALIGRWQTEGFGAEAGPSINKRKNMPQYQREDYGYPTVPMAD